MGVNNGQESGRRCMSFGRRIALILWLPTLVLMVILLYALGFSLGRAVGMSVFCGFVYGVIFAITRDPKPESRDVL